MTLGFVLLHAFRETISYMIEPFLVSYSSAAPVLPAIVM